MTDAEKLEAAETLIDELEVAIRDLVHDAEAVESYMDGCSDHDVADQSRNVARTLTRLGAVLDGWNIAQGKTRRTQAEYEKLREEQPPS